MKPTTSHVPAGPYRTPGEPSKVSDEMSPAAIWCSLNGWMWPGGRPVADEQERDVMRLCFGSVRHLTEDGLRLWRERLESGLDPVTGLAR